MGAPGGISARRPERCHERVPRESGARKAPSRAALSERRMGGNIAERLIATNIGRIGPRPNSAELGPCSFLCCGQHELYNTRRCEVRCA